MIGAMAFSGRNLAAALLLAVASLVTGCDAGPQAPPSETGAELGRSASELDEETDEGDAEDAAEEGGSASEEEVVGPSGVSSPLDPRAEPNPIPWVPRAPDQDA